MYRRWLVTVLVATVAISPSCSSTVEKTCADLTNAVQKTSSNLAPEIQDCAPYIVTKCCGEEGGCAATDTASISAPSASSGAHVNGESDMACDGDGEASEVRERSRWIWKSMCPTGLATCRPLL